MPTLTPVALNSGLAETDGIMAFYHARAIPPSAPRKGGRKRGRARRQAKQGSHNVIFKTHPFFHCSSRMPGKRRAGILLCRLLPMGSRDMRCGD